MSRCQGEVKRLYFRADSGVANPETVGVFGNRRGDARRS
jgi:hypothetical protein